MWFDGYLYKDSKSANDDSRINNTNEMRLLLTLTLEIQFCVESHLINPVPAESAADSVSLTLTVQDSTTVPPPGQPSSVYCRRVRRRFAQF